MKYAPFIVPTLCRSEHFIRMIESLKRNTWACYTDVIVGVDYPLTDNYRRGWLTICDYLDQGDFSAFHQFIVFKQQENLGAGRNEGVLNEYVRQHYDRWIRCDDDCEFSPDFLEYMDKCLDAFEDDPDVVAVTGYAYPLDWKTAEGATCMKQQFDAATWGLGQWMKKNRVYQEYIRSGRMLDDAKMVIKNGYYQKMITRVRTDYFNRTVRDPKVLDYFTVVTDVGLRTYLTCKDKYCISPIVSRVRNCGFDGSGLVCHHISQFDNTRSDSFDYQHQVIAASDHFDIVLNNQRYLQENTSKMDAFVVAPMKAILLYYFNFFIIKYFGLGFARRLHRVLLFGMKFLGLK